MLRALRAWILTAAQFPRKSTADLRWLEGICFALGMVSMVVALLWFPGWQTAAWILVAMCWARVSVLARKEIRRRSNGDR